MPKEPSQLPLSQELDPCQPKLPEFPNFTKIHAKAELGKASALLQLRKRKDWANSAVFLNHVMQRDYQHGVLDTIESATSAAALTTMEQDRSVISANETEYLSKLFCQQLSMRTVADDGAEDEEEEEGETWKKAVKTEGILREEVALHRRLPKEVWKSKTLRNLIKVLLRLKKLYQARGSAIKVLRSLMRLKESTRRHTDSYQDVFKQTISIRTSLLEFRQDFKIFGAEFIFEDINLYEAFDAMQRAIKTYGEKNPKEAFRKIKQELVFPADMLRDSYETLEVRNILNDSLNDEEEKSTDRSLFDEINVIDCNRTIKAKSQITGSEFRLNLAEVPSAHELDQTVRLSVEHCINFDLRDRNAILNHFNHKDAASDAHSALLLCQDENLRSDNIFRDSALGRLAA